MQNLHRFILKPYKGPKDRTTCPGCGKRGCFSNYIDSTTGSELAEGVGRCNREVNCGYHYTPKQYFAENPGSAPDPNGPRNYQPAKREPAPPASLMPEEVLNKSLTAYASNWFVQYLRGLFPEEVVNRLIASYQIGTSKHWEGSTVFWQISKRGEIRAGKIMLYSPATGKRVKEPFSHITWVHKALELEGYNLRQCLFGEHLLTLRPADPVAIVESEKTAVIAAAYLPGFIWLACGSLNNLSMERCRVLAGRTVTLFPDLNGFDKWSAKAGELAGICSITTSDVLEAIATPQERANGLDLADYLTRTPFAPPSASQSLKQAFKAEFLGPEELHPDRQRDLWLTYIAQGLTYEETKEVLTDLLEKHAFNLY